MRGSISGKGRTIQNLPGCSLSMLPFLPSSLSSRQTHEMRWSRSGIYEKRKKKRKGRRRLGGDGRALRECVQLRRSADHDRAHTESGAIHYGRHSERASERANEGANERTLPSRDSRRRGAAAVTKTDGDDSRITRRLRQWSWRLGNAARLLERTRGSRRSVRTLAVGASLFLPSIDSPASRVDLIVARVDRLEIAGD